MQVRDEILDTLIRGREMLEKVYCKYVVDDGMGGHCSLGVVGMVRSDNPYHYLDEAAILYIARHAVMPTTRYPDHLGFRNNELVLWQNGKLDSISKVACHNNLNGKEATLKMWDDAIAERLAEVNEAAKEKNDMCIYSATLEADQFRAAEPVEAVRLGQIDGYGHNGFIAKSDNKIVCVADRTEIHLDNFDIRDDYKAVNQVAMSNSSDFYVFCTNFGRARLEEYIGKPLKTWLVQPRPLQSDDYYSADCILLPDGRLVAIRSLAPTTAHIGPKPQRDLVKVLDLDKTEFTETVADPRVLEPAGDD